jgi:hypothetical protein
MLIGETVVVSYFTSLSIISTHSVTVMLHKNVYFVCKLSVKTVFCHILPDFIMFGRFNTPQLAAESYTKPDILSDCEIGRGSKSCLRSNTLQNLHTLELAPWLLIGFSVISRGHSIGFLKKCVKGCF